MDYRKQIERKAKKSELFSAKIAKNPKDCIKATHVILPSNVRTKKTLVGAAVGAWMIRPQWLEDSLEKNEIQPPEKYGYKCKVKPYEGKSIFLSNGFKEVNKEKHFDEFSSIILLGGGSMCNSALTADIILVSNEEKKNKSFELRGECQTWDDFFNNLQPFMDI